jgi:hypothetical protein
MYESKLPTSLPDETHCHALTKVSSTISSASSALSTIRNAYMPNGRYNRLKYISNSLTFIAKTTLLVL